MKWIFAIVFGLFCLAPTAQAQRFRGGFGHGYNYGFRSYTPFYSYSLFTPFVPVQTVAVEAAEAVVPVTRAAVVSAEVAPAVPLAVISSGFSGYAGSYGYGRSFYAPRRIHRLPLRR